jgi:hypothetical protein
MPKPCATIPIATKSPALSSLSDLSPLQLALTAATNLRQNGCLDQLFQRRVWPHYGPSMCRMPNGQQMAGLAMLRLGICSADGRQFWGEPE